jgi:hypothetical protein
LTSNPLIKSQPDEKQCKTSVIDCGGYRLSFDMILFLWLGHWLLTMSMWFNYEGRASE